MSCATDLAERNRQADEADAALYQEEVDRRAEALMQPGAACDPARPENFKLAADRLGTEDTAEITAFWWGRAEIQAIAEISQHTRPRYRSIHRKPRHDR